MGKIAYGLTHKESGEPMVRVVTTTKVGIGLPQGKAVHVYIDLGGKWIVMEGTGKSAQRHECTDKVEARRTYLAASQRAPERKYPGRLPHFTFTRVSSDGTYQPDWDAIELHGSLPTEVPVIFFKDEPLDVEYAMFTATEKKCWGDGRDALRIVSLTTNKAQKETAEAAIENGEKYYKIENGCAIYDCPFAKNKECKPHGRLYFQLTKAPRLGTSAYFDTTGRRSIGQLFSCLQDFRSFTGRGDAKRGFVAGIPLWLTVRPYRVRYTDKTGEHTSTQYSVGLEFRGEGMEPERLVQGFIAAGVDYRIRAAEPLQQLEAGRPEIETVIPTEKPVTSPEQGEVVDISGLDEDLETIVPEVAPALNGEFYPEGEGDSEMLMEMEEPLAPQMPKRKSEAQAPVEPALEAKTKATIADRIDKMLARGYEQYQISAILESAAGVRQIEHITSEGDAARTIALLDSELRSAGTKKKR